MGKAIKSMTLEQARAYQKELKSQGKTASTSKEYGKVENYIKTLKPENYGKETVSDAYKQLSSGVKYTGGWTEKNLGNIEKYTGTKPQLISPSSVTSPDNLSSYLNNYQDSVYGSAGSPELRESIAAQLEPDMEKPEPLNRVEEYETMRQNMGVADLETTLTDLKAQLEQEYATTRARKFDAEGKPVALGVIGGRVTEIERQQNERVDALGRQINVITDQLNTAYNTISTYINYMGLDYQDAVQAYNDDYNKNLQIYKLVDEEMDEQEASARANLQTFINAITNGNISYGSLSGDQKAMISKLEAQSGLPIGFTSKLQLSPKDRLIKISDDGSEAYFWGEGGKIEKKSTGVTFKTSGGTAGQSTFRSLLEKGRADLESGRDWSEVWERIRNDPASANYTNKDIDVGLGGSGGDPTTEADDTGWAKGGAYEDFRAKTGTVTSASRDQEAVSALSEAVSTYQRATTEKQKEDVKNAFVRDYPDYAEKFIKAVGY